MSANGRRDLIRRLRVNAEKATARQETPNTISP
jgi:hypothetical protein